MKKLIVLTAILAGATHASYVAIEHWSEFPQLEFAFFVTAGLAQIIWALLFLKKDSASMYYLGLLINGSILVTWLLTRTVSAPFQEGAEHIGAVGTTIAVLEVIAIVSLIRWSNKNKKQSFKAILLALVIILAGGAATYGSSMAMELVFPDRVFSHTHGQDDYHDEDGEHIDDELHMDNDEHVDDIEDHDEEMNEAMEDSHEEEDDHPHDEDDQH